MARTVKLSKLSELHELVMDEQSKSCTLEVLNDDCLREILKFLKQQPHVLLRLYGLFDRLDALLNELRLKYINFKFLDEKIDDAKWDPNNFQDALTFMGPNLRLVTLYSHNPMSKWSKSDIYHQLHQLCPKLECVDIISDKTFAMHFMQ